MLPFLLRGMIWNALRCALRINSGRIILIFGIAERLRTLRYPIFTGEVFRSSYNKKELPLRCGSSLGHDITRYGT